MRGCSSSARGWRSPCGCSTRGPRRSSGSSSTSTTSASTARTRITASRSPLPVARAVLWDLDGTLADSREYHWRAWRATLAAEGITLSHDQFLASFGQRNDLILARWLGREAPPALVQRVGEEKEARFRELVRAGGLTPLPGAARWVRRLAETGWRQAIASSAPRENVVAMIAALGFGSDLGAFVAAEDVTAGKPDPQV